MLGLIKTHVMTATSAPTVKAREHESLGLIESASVNSFTDFVPSKFNQGDVNSERDIKDVTNSFICHLIFYVIFCVSLVLHILIDLGLGSFIKCKFDQLVGSSKGIEFKKNPAFA